MFRPSARRDRDWLILPRRDSLPATYVTAQRTNRPFRRACSPPDRFNSRSALLFKGLIPVSCSYRRSVVTQSGRSTTAASLCQIITWLGNSPSRSRAALPNRCSQEELINDLVSPESVSSWRGEAPAQRRAGGRASPRWPSIARFCVRPAPWVAWFTLRCAEREAFQIRCNTAGQGGPVPTCEGRTGSHNGEPNDFIQLPWSQSAF
jgi:hypothetical protein